MAGLNDVFRELHRLRKHARDVQQEIDRAPIQLKARRNQAAKLQAAWAEAQDSLKKLKVATHEKEVSLKEAHALLAKYRRQLDEASDNKQYEALQHEIATQTERGNQLEEQILESMSEAEERAAKLPEHERAAKKAAEDLKAFEQEQKQRLERLAAQLRETLEQIREAEKTIPAEFVHLYNRMVASYGADCLAEVRDQACSFCNTKVTSQQINELEMGKFVSCRSCYRGLYVTPRAAALPEEDG